MPGPRRRLFLRALLWLAVLTPLFYASYGLANHLAAARASVPSIVFAWEHDVPFLAWTIFPYWSINLFYALALFLCRSRHELDRHGLRLLSAQGVAVACFIALPLQFSFGQPSAEGVAGALFASLRSFDRPFNQAPSLHIALACILWDLYRRLLNGAAARLVLHAWTFLVCVSVLTTFQHHFIDIPTGALLGLLCIWLWPLERRPSPLHGARLARDPQRLKLAFLYSLGALAMATVAFTSGGAMLWLVWPALALGAVACNYAWLGERGFAKGRDGRGEWASRLLLAPYRGAAWLNSRWWTRRQPLPIEVVRGLWLGRVPSRRDVVAACASIVDVSAELNSSLARPTVAVPMLDLVVPSPERLRRAARAITRQRAAHGSVLVCCALGYSRSAAAVCAWLVGSDHCRDAAAAAALLHERQARVVLSPAHLQAIDLAAGRAPPTARPDGHAYA